ncbi:chalcone isomerase family protein [Oceanimonas pelagia]|uniref:Chalcone isomerase family protein n=1 Tax=Oceanimonas pelagia TaxID=3028314 RepID=A0AA50KM02_9GAMM|nr:chalcone isomerase family protein [Oceanimonas pelagia]WMC09362.1 chalcone isomerase family protein [Oceanimonas pelagia]
MKRLCLLLLLVVSSASASPVADLALVGQGKMSWLFWDLYQARFYSENGRYQPGQYPQALSLRYARNIDKEDLLAATIEEWQRLGVNWKPEWPERLAQLWPSVRTNDELVLRVDENGASSFYFNWRLLGRIDDPAFAPAFLAIWLSPDSRDPALTRQLKGG